MRIYKIYDLTSLGHFKYPPQVVLCRDDDDALFAANQRNSGVDREIWQGDRQVAVVNANEVCRMTAIASDMRETVMLTRAAVNNSHECLRNADQLLNRR